jgi:hypothetical protein
MTGLGSKQVMDSIYDATRLGAADLAAKEEVAKKVYVS